jgi:hypothetical protein
LFKAIRYEKQILIVLLWSVLIFIGYNVLTAEASEKEDKKVCEDYGGEWKKSANSGGERWCNFDNDKDRQAYSIRPGYTLDGTGSDAEYGRLDLDVSDEEAAAQEDAICDDEDADYTNIKICMSDKREQQLKNIEKACDKVDGKMTKDGCDTDGSGDTPKADKFHEELDQIEKETGYPSIETEDWRNEVYESEGPPPEQENKYDYKIASPTFEEVKE